MDTENLQVLREIAERPLTPEEKKMRNSCLISWCWKVVLPINIFTHFFSLRKLGSKDLPTKSTPNSVKMILYIVGNFCVITGFLKPLCDYTVLVKRIEEERMRRKLTEQPNPLVKEEIQPSSRPDDFSYVDLSTNLNEPEDSFSTDFISTTLNIEDENKEQKPRTVTYQDLRELNRLGINQPPSPPNSTLNFGSGTTPSSPSQKPAPTKEPSSPPRPRKLNKYGDEIE